MSLKEAALSVVLPTALIVLLVFLVLQLTRPELTVARCPDYCERAGMRWAGLAGTRCVCEVRR